MTRVDVALEWRERPEVCGNDAHLPAAAESHYRAAGG
ncbi:hypothetical protein MGAST_17160 [Mycobacterium gastri 'Wayne']|nr:hypothetical protein MGAST_17160 [Mycobacterium gastri 'Wayne']